MRHVYRIALTLLGLATAALSAGCGPVVKNPTTLQESAALTAPAQERLYVLGPGDQIDVRFFYNPDLNVPVTIRPDGRLSIPLANEVPAAGKTVEELTAILHEKYAPILRRPDLSLIVRSFNAHKVFVGGEVGSPGVFESVGAMTVLQSVAQAGGFKDTARMDEVIILRRGPGNERHVIPVNLTAAIEGTDTTQDTMLQPFDIVFVPLSPIAEANKFVDQYIRKLLPVEVAAPFLLF